MNILNNPNVEIVELNTNKKDNEIRFDLDLLEECTFKKMLRYFNDITMAPLEYILTVLLISLSGVVGKKVYWKFSKSFSIYLNIWAVLCGPSTLLKKSSAIQTVLHDLFRIDELLRNDYKKRKEEYEKEIKNKDQSEKKNLTKPQRKYLVLPSDVTIESLGDILAVADRGLMIQSEFGGFLAQLERSYSNGAKQVLTDLFDVPIHKEVSRATKGNTIIERPCFSLVGASTVEWIRSNSNKDDLRTGFFSRILFSIRNRNDKPLISIFDLERLSYRSIYYFETREVYNFLSELNTETILSATDKAKTIYKQYEKDSYFELENIENNDELSFKGRLIIYTLKFAGLLALSEQRFEVNEMDMSNAIQIAKYYSKNIERMINDELITKSDFTIKENKIYEKIKKIGSISRVVLLKSNITVNAKELDLVLSNLSEKEMIELDQQKKGSSNKARFYRIKQETA